jgi:4-nitrophenyl phosphatase
VLLAERQPRPRLSMVFGGPGLERELQEAELSTVPPTAEGLAAAPDALVVGVDFDLTYERLSVAAEAVRRGALFVATNRDPIYPAEEGLMAGAGSIVAAVAVAAGREPDLVVGKPEPRLFEAAAEVAGVPVQEAVVIGDGLLTDIRAAIAVGARSVLMLTGVTTAAEAERAVDGDRPTAVARDATDLDRILEEFAAG